MKIDGLSPLSPSCTQYSPNRTQYSPDRTHHSPNRTQYSPNRTQVILYSEIITTFEQKELLFLLEFAVVTKLRIQVVKVYSNAQSDFSLKNVPSDH